MNEYLIENAVIDKAQLKGKLGVGFIQLSITAKVSDAPAFVADIGSLIEQPVTLRVQSPQLALVEDLTGD